MEKSNGNRKRLRPPKDVSIRLSGEDQELLDKIASEYGLIKITDCLRLAIREAVKRINVRQSEIA